MEIVVGDKVIRQMPVNDLESVLALQKSDVHPDIVSKATHALAACKAGLPRVHVLQRQCGRKGCWRRSFTNEGVGHPGVRERIPTDPARTQKECGTIMNLTKTS
jgi:amino-acid N-acetyltransferase